MQHITNSFDKYKDALSKSEKQTAWQEIVGIFSEKYNRFAIPRYKRTYARMAMLLAPLLRLNGIDWLRNFYLECEKKDNFGKWFNYSINPKNSKDGV